MRVFDRSAVLELLDRIRCGRLRVQELGMLPVLRSSSIDHHIFPVHFCYARRIYKMRWKREENKHTDKLRLVYVHISRTARPYFGQACCRSCKQLLDDFRYVFHGIFSLNIDLRICNTLRIVRAYARKCKLFQKLYIFH